MSKQKLLIYYGSFQLSGIETWLIKQIEFAKNNDISVIWVTSESGEVYDEWKTFIEESVVRIDSKTGKIEPVKEEISKYISINDSVTAVCFGFFDFYDLISFKIKNNYTGMHCYNIIPHFEMSCYYPEDTELFRENSIQRKLYRNIVRRKAGRVYKECANNSLLFFNRRHIQEVENRYNITVNNPNDKILKPTSKTRPFDEKLIREKWERDTFTIISCGRFDFPHKGYVLGLIRAFNQLKDEYPQLKLDIIGYGDNDTVNQVISECSTKAQKDIRLLGQVNPNDLSKYFDESHLNISVAGALNVGAKNGVLSLPARHYSYDCEVYGYLPESAKYLLSEEPGEDVIPYIKDIINLDVDEYVKLCRDSYDTACKKADVDELWLFSLNNEKANEKLILQKYEKLISFMDRTNRIASLLHKIKHNYTSAHCDKLIFVVIIVLFFIAFIYELKEKR